MPCVCDVVRHKILVPFFFCFLFEKLQRVGGVGGHQEGWQEPDEVSDYSTSSGTMRNHLNAMWVSALYGSALLKYISPSSSSFTLSTSSSRRPAPHSPPVPLIGDAIKVRGVSASSR